jgi:hypothetical protein
MIHALKVDNAKACQYDCCLLQRQLLLPLLYVGTCNRTVFETWIENA